MLKPFKSSKPLLSIQHIDLINNKKFHITGPLLKESTSDWWILFTNAQ